MRTAVTVAKKHKGGWVMLADPDVPLQDQNKLYRGFLLEKVHPDYCYVQLQESDGLFRRTHLRTPEDHEEHIENLEKQNEEAREAGRNELESREKVLKDSAEYRAKQNQGEIDALNKLAEKDGNKNPAKPDKGTEVPAPAAPAATGTLKADGPTIEDWVEQGFSPLSYPPENFAAVESTGLAEYKTTGKITPRVAPAAPAISEVVSAEPKAEEAPSAPIAVAAEVAAPIQPEAQAAPEPEPAPVPQVAEAPAQAAPPAVESQPEVKAEGNETPSTPAAKPEGETKKGRGSKKNENVQ